MPKDAEHDAIDMQYAIGYPSLAEFIASDTDKSTCIYRRFDRLSARNLLYLQSELVELEAEQDALETADQYSNTDELKSSRDWNILKARGSGGSMIVIGKGSGLFMRYVRSSRTTVRTIKRTS